MTTRGSKATATGLALTVIAVSAGVGSTGTLVLLLSFGGVLAGASLIAIGVRMADDDHRPPPRAALSCLRRNLGLVGLLLASSAASTTAADRPATAPVLRFSAFALMLLGISLLSIGFLLGEQEQ